MDDELIKRLLTMVAESKAENFFVATLVGRLITELALLTPDPGGKVEEIISQAQGQAQGVAHFAGGEYTGTTGITAIMERIAASAEDALRSARRNGGKIV